MKIDATVSTERLLLTLAESSLAQPWLEYCQRNADFLKEYEPCREEAFFSIEFQQKRLNEERRQAEDDHSYRLYIARREKPSEIIGMIGLNNIVRGAFQSCFLGYKLDYRYIKQGYMTEAVKRCVRLAFDELQLHRIEANVMPRNIASQRVLEKCGFEREGYAKQYLKINGVWEDHIHFVMLSLT